MKILVTGKGGREHAIVTALRDGGHDLFCHPGSDAIRLLAATPPVSGLTELADWMEEQGIDLCVAGEETWLVEGEGLAKLCADRGVPCWGPSRAAAHLEASKEFAKDFMRRHAVPTASYATAGTLSEAEALLPDGPSVLKFDGLAAGKGVAVCDTKADARAFLSEIFEQKRFGEGRVVIEERLSGPEISIFASVVDGNFHWLMSARDYKRASDHDKGPNTGGMGAVASDDLVSAELRREIEETVIRPTVNGLVTDNLPYRGFLYFGLMLTRDGPKLLEYNCRFGDPEAEAVLPMARGDFAGYLAAGAVGKLRPELIRFVDGWSITVILASAGYPDSARSGDQIHGLDQVGDAQVFHCGTRRGENGWETAGGRVLAVTCGGSTREEALSRVSLAHRNVNFAGCQRRSDIGRLHFES